MKVLLYISALLLTVVSRSTAFLVSPVIGQNAVATTSTTAMSMGLFDLFSEEARKERKERDQRERDEQEEMQQQILERRRNPDSMQEYEARVAVRRKLYMSGLDDAAKEMVVMKDVPKSED